jgi:hypothetical protein
MARSSQQPKEESFNLRIDLQLKAAFQAAAEAEDKPAAQVLREFMRWYVAGRQSRLIGGVAADPNSEEAKVMRWLEDVSDDEGWRA